MNLITTLATKRPVRLAVVATVALGVLMVGAVAANAAMGKVRTQSTPLIVRSGPGTGFEAVDSVAKGSTIEILCQTKGTRVKGTYGATNVWNKLGEGRYVSDAYTSSNEKAPKCTDEVTPRGARVASGPAKKRIEAVIAVAKAQVGKYPYSYGGGNYHQAHYGIYFERWDDRKVTGFDCSGLMQFAYYQGAGVKIPNRVAAGQYDDGIRVAWENRRPGDMVFWSDRSKTQRNIHHVAMYIGDDMIVEAANHRADLRVRSISENEKGLMPFVARPIY